MTSLLPARIGRSETVERTLGRWLRHEVRTDPPLTGLTGWRHCVEPLHNAGSESAGATVVASADAARRVVQLLRVLCTRALGRDRHAMA